MILRLCEFGHSGVLVVWYLCSVPHVLVLLRCRKKLTEHNTNGNGSICYQNALNFTLEICEKHKPETRVSERHKPGFRVWQNERVSPGPGFSKTRVAIPSPHRLFNYLTEYCCVYIFCYWQINFELSELLLLRDPVKIILLYNA